MSDDKTSVGSFIKNNVVSWVIELVVLSVMASFTISEIRRNGEETRALLQKYDKALSSFAANNAENVTTFIENQTKDKAISKQDIIDIVKEIKKPE
jgi:hypothetical protein